MSPRILRRPVCTPESESESECRPHYGQKLSWAGLCSLLAAMALDTDFLSLINPKHVSYRVRRYKALLATDHDPQIQHLSTGRRGRHPSIPRLRHTPYRRHAIVVVCVACHPPPAARLGLRAPVVGVGPAGAGKIAHQEQLYLPRLSSV